MKQEFSLEKRVLWRVIEQVEEAKIGQHFINHSKLIF